MCLLRLKPRYKCTLFFYYYLFMCVPWHFKSICTRFLCDKPQAGPDKPPPVKTVGPLTDVDIVKLRLCEKKPVHISDNHLSCT